MGGAGCNHPRAVVPDVDLAVDVAEAAHDLRMRGVDMIGLAKRLLTDLPVAGHDLGDVSLLIESAQIPAFKLWGEVANELIERIAVAIRVDENEASPARDRQFGQVECLLIDLGEVPVSGNLLERSVQFLAEAVEWTPQFFRVAVELL